MAVFLLIAALGVALGFAFRVTVLVFASAVTLIAVFVLSKLTGAGTSSAAFDAFIGLLGLQVGYFAGMVGSGLAIGASQRIGGATVVDGHDVSEAARADERLREVERLSRSTLDALTEHIAVVEADGTIATVNKAWREFAGCERHIAVGGKRRLELAGRLR